MNAAGHGRITHIEITHNMSQIRRANVSQGAQRFCPSASGGRDLARVKPWRSPWPLGNAEGRNTAAIFCCASDATTTLGNTIYQMT